MQHQQARLCSFRVFHLINCPKAENNVPLDFPDDHVFHYNPLVVQQLCLSWKLFHLCFVV